MQENAVILRLDNTIPYTTLNDQSIIDAVQVSYTPGNSPLKDSHGNIIAGFSDLPVANNTSQNLTYTYSPVGGNNQNYNNTFNQVVINFNTPLNTEIIPSASNFNITVNGQNIAVDSVLAVSNQSVTLNAGTPITGPYTVTYTPGSSPLTNLQTVDNSQVSAFSIDSSSTATPTGLVNSTTAGGSQTNQVIANLEQDFAEDSPPTLALTSTGDILLAWSSDSPLLLPLSILADGNGIYFAFGQDLNNNQTAGTLPTADQFIVNVNGSPVQFDTSKPPNVSGNTLSLTLNQAIAATDTVTVSYILSSTNTTNLNFTDPTGTVFWLTPFNDLAVTVADKSSSAPAPLGVELNGNNYNGYGLATLLVIPFSQTLTIPSNNEISTDAFTVLVNGQSITLNQATVNATSVILSLASSIPQGNLVSVRYDATSGQLKGTNDKKVDSFSSSSILTTPPNPSTVIKTAFSPFGDKGISTISSIPGTSGLNFDPFAFLYGEKNIIAWVNADTSDIPSLLIPGQIYTDNQATLINNSLEATDIYYSVLGPDNQWSAAAPLVSQQPGTDRQVTLGLGPNGQLMAAWLNTQTDNNGNLTTSIYYSLWQESSNFWSAPASILSTITPDPFTGLSIASLNGNPAIFWTETQPTSYSELVLESDPVVYLRLSDLSGTTARNEGLLAGSANGVYSGRYTLNQIGALQNPNATGLSNLGDPNRSTLFNGGQVSVENLPVIGQNFSVEFWFKVPNLPSEALNLVAFDDLFAISLDSTAVTLSLGNGQQSAVTGSTTITTDTWYYVVATYALPYQSQSGTLSLYINGEAVGSLDQVTFADAPTVGTLTLAGWGGDVYLDEVALYNSALTYNPNSSLEPNPTQISASQLLDLLGSGNQIGDRYAAQYADPIPPGPQTYHSVWNGSAWQSSDKINPTPRLTPTALSDANPLVWDIVSNATASPNGHIHPNGILDIYLPLSLTNQQAQTLTSVVVTANLDGQTVSWAIGSGVDASTQQLGIVQGNKLLNSLNPDGPNFSYSVNGATQEFGLFVDPGNNSPSAYTNFQVSINGGSPISVTPSSTEPTNGAGTQVLGIATVTETEDSSLTLIDSGFIISTDNTAIGAVLASAFDSSGNLVYVAVGNRGYTDSSGTVVSPPGGGTVQILFAGGAVLSNNETNPLTTTDLSGNPNGVLITGITDGGAANNSVPMSLATGDVDGDGVPDLVIGDGNANSGKGAIYVIYGSQLTAGTTIDVSNLSTTASTIGFVVNGLDAGGLAGFAVAVGNFDGDGQADIVFGAPLANDSAGSVYVVYGSTVKKGNPVPTPSKVYSGQANEYAGYALGVSHYMTNGTTNGPTTFTGSNATDDLIIGAPGYAVTVTNQWSGQSGLPKENQNLYPATTSVAAGAVYVFASSSTGTTTGINSSPTYTLTGPSSPAKDGVAADSFLGAAIANGVSSMDLDGDGQQDLAVSATGVNNNTGVVYVVQGGSSSLVSSSSQGITDVANLVINGGIAGSKTGFTISSPGDINDDGYQDFLINAPQSANAAGQSYLLFGPLTLDSLGTLFDLSPTASDSKTTFLLNGSEPFQSTGQAAIGVGDINNDGVDDLLVTSPGAQQIYAVYGHPWLADDGSIKLSNISGDNGFVIDGDLYSVQVGTQIENLNSPASNAPGLISHDGVLYLAYQGNNSTATASNTDYNIYFTTSNDGGQTWQSSVQLSSDFQTSSPPALAFYNDVLYLAYLGQSNNELNFIYSTNNGQSWSSSQVTLSNQTSGAGISLVEYQGYLMAFFVASDSSNDILYVYSDNPNNSSSWSTAYTVTNPGGGSQFPNQTASDAVSATVLNNTLYLAYRGGIVGKGDNYYVTSTSGTSLSSLSWPSVTEVSNATNPNTAPGLTNDGNNLYLTYGDSTTSNALYYLTSSNGSDWSGENAISNQFSGFLPSATILSNRLYVGYTGGTTDVYVSGLDADQFPLLGTGNNVAMLGDINGDGFADVLAGGSPYGAIITFGASTQDLLDAAAGTDELVITVSNNGQIQDVLSLGDFNGDGLQDFGLLDTANTFYVLLGNNSLGTQGTLTVDSSYSSVSDISQAARVADYNGDGYDDILLTTTGGNQILYLGNSGGNLSNSQNFSSSSNTVFNGIGDINGDGFADIGGGAPNSNQVSGIPATPIYSLPNQSADTAPALISNNDTLYMAYKGDNTDTYLYFTTSTNGGPTWQSATQLSSDFNTDSSPALAFYNGVLYLAYLGEDNNELNFVYSSDNGQSWSSSQITLSNQTSGAGISLVEYQGYLMAFFVASDSSSDILYIYSNNPSDSSSWSNAYAVTNPGGGSAYPNQTASDTVSATVLNKTLYLAYRGGTVGSGSNYYVTSTSENSLSSLSWSSVTEVSNATNPNTAPGLTNDGNNLYLTYGDSTTSNSLYYLTSSNGTDWSSLEAITAQTSAYEPAATILDGHLYLGYAGGNQDLYVTYLPTPSPAVGNGQASVYLGNQSATSTGTTLNPPTAPQTASLDNSDWGFYTSGDGSDSNSSLSGQQTSSALSFAVYNGYIYMVYSGTDSPSTTYLQRSADGYNWEGLTNLGSSFETDSQASLAVFNNTLYLAFTSTSGEVILAPSKTDETTSLGLSFSSDTFFQVDSQTANSGPTLVVYDGALYIFFEAQDNSNAPIRYNYSAIPSVSSSWNGTGSSIDSGGQYTKDRVGAAVLPGSANDGAGTLVVTFMANDESGDIYASTYTGGDDSSWTTNQVSGQTTAYGPSLVEVNGTLYLFFRADADQVSNYDLNYMTSTNGSTWANFSQIPGQTSADRPTPVYFQESILVGFLAEAATNQDINVSTSNSLYEPNQTQQFGSQLEPIGDFNGDGIADFAVLAPGFFSNLGSWNNNLLENNQGAIFIYYGSTSGLSSSATPDVVLSVPAPTGSTNVANNQAMLLTEFAGAGDINGDGYDDLILASPNTALDSSNTTDGLVFVVFGGGNALWGNQYGATKPFDLGLVTNNISQLTLEFSQDLLTNNVPDTSAFTVNSNLTQVTVESLTVESNQVILNLNSDVNLSGFVSVTYTAPSSGGLEYASSGNPQVPTFTTSNDPSINSSIGITLSYDSSQVGQTQYGFQITGLPGSQSGISLSGGGDVNGDGFSDFVIGSPGSGDNLTYVLFGSDFNNTVNQTGTIGDDVMVGTPTGESFVAGQGDDQIYTNGGMDIVYAGPGDDYATVSDTYFRRLDGGTGKDTLAFTGYNGQNWDLTTLSPRLRLRNFEIVVTEGYGSNILTLNSLTVMALSPTNTVTLYLDPTDFLVLSDDFSDSPEKVYQNKRNFLKYTSSRSAATVLVNQTSSTFADNSVSFNAPETNIPVPIFPSNSNLVASTFAIDNNNSTLGTQSFVTPQSNPNAPTQLFVSNPTVSELDGVANFTIQRTGDLSNSVLVSYLTQDGDGKAGDRYLPVAGRLLFAPNETSKTVSVRIPNNGRYIGDRQFGLLVTLLGEGNDLGDFPLSFRLEGDANGEQIRRWNQVSRDTQNGLWGGTLQFDTTTTNRHAIINIFTEGISDFNTFYSYNAQTGNYDELMFNGDTGAIFLYDNTPENYDKPRNIQLTLRDGDRGDIDNTLNGLAKTNGYAGRTIPGLITNNNKTFWAPTTADGQVQWRLIATPSENYELGWIMVDDQNGTINGLNPNDQGYEAAALARKQIVFQNQNNSSANALTRTIAQESFTNPSNLAQTEKQFFGNFETSNLTANQYYMLYTSEGTKTTFSVTESPEIQTDSRGYHQISFNGITAEIGSSTLIIPGVLNQSVKMEASLSRAAAYNNLIALYRVDSLTGDLDMNGDKLIDIKPGDLGYTQAALTRAKDTLTGVILTTPENLGTTQQTINLLGNNMYGMVIIPNATIEQVLNQNPSNDPSVGPVAFFSFGSANPDGISHMARLGSNLFGFEDLLGGGDQDYNDMILQLNEIKV